MDEFGDGVGIKDAHFVYEYRDRAGHTVFVGAGKFQTAMAPACNALQGVGHGDCPLALYWFLRDLIGYGAADHEVAPYFVEAFSTALAAKVAAEARITAYGGPLNLLLAYSETGMTPQGVYRAPWIRLALPGDVPALVNLRTLKLPKLRQVGFCARFISHGMTNWLKNGRWYFGPVWSDPATNRKHLVEITKRPANYPWSQETFEKEYISKKFSTFMNSNRRKNFDEGYKFAGFVQEMIDKTNFIIETDEIGMYKAYHDIMTPIGHYAQAEHAVLSAERETLKVPSSEHPAILERLRNGDYLLPHVREAFVGPVRRSSWAGWRPLIVQQHAAEGGDVDGKLDGDLDGPNDPVIANPEPSLYKTNYEPYVRKTRLIRRADLRHQKMLLRKQKRAEGAAMRAVVVYDHETGEPDQVPSAIGSAIDRLRIAMGLPP